MLHTLGFDEPLSQYVPNLYMRTEIRKSRNVSSMPCIFAANFGPSATYTPNARALALSNRISNWSCAFTRPSRKCYERRKIRLQNAREYVGAHHDFVVRNGHLIERQAIYAVEQSRVVARI